MLKHYIYLEYPSFKNSNHNRANSMRHKIKYLLNCMKPTRIITDNYGISYVDDRRSALEQHIVKKGEFDEFIIFKQFIEHFKFNGRNRLAIDIGANVGLMSLPLATYYDKVISFEADPQNCQRMKNNISLNENLSVELNDHAIGDIQGQLKISINRSIDGDGFLNTGLSSLAYGNRKHSTALVDVNVTTLDAFVESSDIEAIDCVKVDTEGFELNVFKGAKNVLNDHKPCIFYESSHAIDKRIGEDMRLKCFEHLSDFGYEHFLISANDVRRVGYTEFKGIKSDLNLFAVHSKSI